MPANPPQTFSYSNPLIGRPQHFVHFYESNDELASSVAAFFLSGLLGGCGCVAIATRDHQAAIVSKLQKCGIDVQHAMQTHQLALFDADKTLAEICSSGEPEQALFTRIASDAIKAVGLHCSRILMFGEMVGMLTARGDHRSALLFEQWCNECLADAPDVQMFCAYPRSETMPMRAYETICCAHSAVL